MKWGYNYTNIHSHAYINNTHFCTDIYFLLLSDDDDICNKTNIYITIITIITVILKIHLLCCIYNYKEV